MESQDSSLETTLNPACSPSSSSGIKSSSSCKILFLTFDNSMIIKLCRQADDFFPFYLCTPFDNNFSLTL